MSRHFRMLPFELLLNLKSVAVGLKFGFELVTAENVFKDMSVT